MLKRGRGNINKYQKIRRNWNRGINKYQRIRRKENRGINKCSKKAKRRGNKGI